MKILFIGNFNVDFTTESHHLKTYRKLGHEVFTLQEDKATIDQIKQNLRVDILIHTHTHGWNIKGIEQIYKICKERNIPTVGYHLDLWRGISREVDLMNDPYWNIEYFFTVDKLFVRDLEARGIKAFYLPAGVIEDECYLAEPDRKRFPHEIVFTGSKRYHEEWQYRPKLINWLQSTYGNKFGHYGGDGLGVVRGHDLNVLYSSAKIVIGDTLCKGFDYPYYFSDRLFEVMGRGGFLIFPYIEGLFDLYSTDDLITYKFDDFNMLKYRIDYWLNHDQEREKIKISGHEATKKNHTYTQRLSYLLQTVNESKFQ